MLLTIVTAPRHFRIEEQTVNRLVISITLFVFLFGSIALFGWADPSSTASSETSLIVIRGVTLIDGTGGPPVVDAVIVVKGNQIAALGRAKDVAVPKNARVIDVHGMFVVPGLIDCHCHTESIGLGDLGEVAPEWQKPEKLKELFRINAKLDLFAGITTVRDLGSTDLLFQVRDEINSGKTPGPRIIAAGHQLVNKAPDAVMDSSFVEYAGPDDARAKVRDQVSLGADVIKIRLAHDRPLPSMEEITAITEEAHRLGIRVAVHTKVPAEDAVKLAVSAGVDSIEHNAALRIKDEGILSEMARRHIAVMPGSGAFYMQRWEFWGSGNPIDPTTRRLFPPDIIALFTPVIKGLHAQSEEMRKQGWDPQQVQARFVGETTRARKAGVMLVFGTDCGCDLVIHGQQYKALYGESQMGSSPMQVLLMATRDAARVLGREAELGTLEPGKLADLVVVDANPLADLRNLAKVHAVMKDGQLYFPAEMIGK